MLTLAVPAFPAAAVETIVSKNVTPKIITVVTREARANAERGPIAKAHAAAERPEDHGSDEQMFGAK